MKRDELIEIREMNEKDLPFVYSTWNRSYYFGDRVFKNIDESSFFNYQSRVIDYILNKPKSKKLVAVLKDDPDILLGYAVYEGPIAHYCYVKDDWRGIGISKLLMPNEIKVATHRTYKVKKKLLEKKIEFDPFQI